MIGTFMFEPNITLAGEQFKSGAVCKYDWVRGTMKEVAVFQGGKDITDDFEVNHDKSQYGNYDFDFKAFGKCFKKGERYKDKTYVFYQKPNKDPKLSAINCAEELQQLKSGVGMLAKRVADKDDDLTMDSTFPINGVDTVVSTVVPRWATLLPVDVLNRLTLPVGVTKEDLE